MSGNQPAGNADTDQNNLPIERFLAIGMSVVFARKGKIRQKVPVWSAGLSSAVWLRELADV